MAKKEVIKVSAAMLAFCLLATAVPAMNADAKAKPKLSKKKVTLTVGKKVKLKVKNAGKKKVKWKTSNKKVAKVNKKGVVKAKKAGKATITAKVGKKKFKCKVIVKKQNRNQNSVNNIYYDEKNAITKYEWANSQRIVKEVLGENYAQMPEMERCWKLATWACDYMTYSSEGGSSNNQTAESAFKKGGKGVCGAYTDLYFCLLKAADVDCIKVYDESRSLHAWNMVEIDGQWYNCDITNMDQQAQVTDKPSNIPCNYNWEYFMKSDSFISQHWSIGYVFRGDENWGEGPDCDGFTPKPPYCTSTKYDDNKYAEDPKNADYINVPECVEVDVTYSVKDSGEMFSKGITADEFEAALDYYNSLPDGDENKYDYEEYEVSKYVEEKSCEFSFGDEKGIHNYYKGVNFNITWKRILDRMFYDYNSNIFTRGEY